MGLIAFDTIIAAHLLNEQTAAGSEDRAVGLSLANVAGMKLGVDDWGKGIHSFGDGKKPPDPMWPKDGADPRQCFSFYVGHDTGITHMLGGVLSSELNEGRNSGLRKLMSKLVLPGAEAIVRMEKNGIWVDFDRVAERRLHYEAEAAAQLEIIMSHIPEELRESADLGNDNFLRSWLFSPPPAGLGLRAVSHTENGTAQVDEKSLFRLAEEANHPVPTAIVGMRKANKAISFFDQWTDYADPFWRLHPYFNMTGTVTGRRSCDSPNLQQVPREKLLRTCIGAPPGWMFLEVDFSQIEVRLAAIFANEETMLRVFSDPNGDIYRYTASRMLGKPEREITKDERQKAKAVVLGFIYGMQAKGFVIYAKDQYGQTFTVQEATQFREAFFTAFPGLVKWHERQKQIVRKNRQVESPVGRIRHLWEILSTSWETSMKAERQAINSPVQGMGGDLILATMVELTRTLDRDRAIIVGDVHDALLFQIREDVWKEEAVRILRTMEAPPIITNDFDFKPPIRLRAEGKIGRYWGEPMDLVMKDGKMTGEFYLDDLLAEAA